MKTSLYISNETLAAVCGSATTRHAGIRSYASAALPEGALINGVITDDRLFALALNELRGKLPAKSLNHVSIAIRSSQIYEKRMAVPPLKPQKLREWIAGEFSGVGGGEPLVADYTILEDAPGGRIALLCAAQRKLIENYLALFAKEGSVVDSIDTALSAQIKLVKLLKSTRERTFILMELDGNRLSASLFVAGNYHFNNSVRLFAERGTPESFSEISRLVSSIIQFNTSDRSGQAITGIFITGLRESEAALPAQLHASFELEAAVLSDADGAITASTGLSFSVADYAYAVGNLIEP